MSGSPRTGDSLDFQACIGDIPCQRCNLPSGVTSQSSGGWKSIRLSPFATGGRGSARVVEPPRRFAPPLDGQSHVAPNVLGEFAVQLFQTQPVGWPPQCETPPADKIQLEGAAHHRPTGWGKTVNQIARNVYGSMRLPVEATTYSGVVLGAKLWKAEKVFPLPDG